jgi:hypothetical protein
MFLTGYMYFLGKVIPETRGLIPRCLGQNCSCQSRKVAAVNQCSSESLARNNYVDTFLFSRWFESCGQGQLIGARFESYVLHDVSHNYGAVRSVRTKCVVVVLYHTDWVRQLSPYRHRIVVTIEMYSMLIQGDTEWTCQISWLYEIMWLWVQMFYGYGPAEKSEDSWLFQPNIKVIKSSPCPCT